MSKSVHILVLRPNRTIVLVNNEIHQFEFSQPKILEWIAHLHNNPPIMIDVTESWGAQLVRDLQALGYSNFSKMAKHEMHAGWHD